MDVAVVDPDTGHGVPAGPVRRRRRLLNPEEAIGEIVGRERAVVVRGLLRQPGGHRRARPATGGTGRATSATGTTTAPSTSPGAPPTGCASTARTSPPDPIERILGRFPGVASAVVYGVPDPRTGDQVMAALELDAGVAFDAGGVRSRSSPSSPTSAPSGRRASCGSSTPSPSPPPARSTASRCAPSAGPPTTRCGGGPSAPTPTGGSPTPTSPTCASAFADAGREGILT